VNSIYANDFGNALFGMLADIAGDIILKTDRYGFIEQSSPGLPNIGLSTDGLLILPHISDLAAPHYARGVREYVRQALSGETQLECVEFPLASATSPEADQTSHSTERLVSKWFALRLRLAPGQTGQPNGALGMLRSIKRPHAIGAGLLGESDVDQLTGLGSRQAFDANLATRLADRRNDTMVLIEIDSFRSLHHRFGPSSRDEIICAFADFLLVMLGADSGLSRMKEARFAFFLEHREPSAARQQVEELLKTFAQLSSDFAGDAPGVFASAGLASLGENAALAISNAEKALILASTNGGSQAKIADDLPHYLAGKRRTR
jgi:GGDEF domain-containing protein